MDEAWKVEITLPFSDWNPRHPSYDQQENNMMDRVGGINKPSSISQISSHSHMIKI